MGMGLNTRENTPTVDSPISTASVEDILRKKKAYSQVAARKGRGDFFKNAPATSSPLSGAGAGSSLLRQKLGE